MIPAPPEVVVNILHWLLAISLLAVIGMELIFILIPNSLKFIDRVTP